MSDSVRHHGLQPTRLLHPWDSPGENTGVGCHFLLQCVKVKSLSRVRLLATPWTVAYQAPPSMGFSSQQYWSGVPLPSPKMKTSSLLKKKKRQSSDYLGTEMNAGGQVWGGRVDGLHGGLRKFQGMMEILCVLSVVLIS